MSNNLVPLELSADHYDVFLLHAETDKNIAENYRDQLENIRYDNGCKVTTCTLEDISWKNSLIDSFNEAVDRSTYTFLLLTENFEHDCWAKLQVDEVIMLTLTERNKQNCLIPVMLHRNSFIPPCTRSIKYLKAYDVDQYYMRNLKKLLALRQHLRNDRMKRQHEKRKTFLNNAKKNENKSVEVPVQVQRMSLLDSRVTEIHHHHYENVPQPEKQNVYNINISSCANVMVGDGSTHIIERRVSDEREEDCIYVRDKDPPKGNSDSGTGSLSSESGTNSLSSEADLEMDGFETIGGQDTILGANDRCADLEQTRVKQVYTSSDPDGAVNAMQDITKTPAECSEANQVITQVKDDSDLDLNIGEIQGMSHTEQQSETFSSGPVSYPLSDVGGVPVSDVTTSHTGVSVGEGATSFPLRRSGSQEIDPLADQFASGCALKQPTNKLRFTLDGSDTVNPRNMDFPLPEASRCVGVDLLSGRRPTSPRPKSSGSPSDAHELGMSSNPFSSFKKTVLTRNRSNSGLNGLVNDMSEDGIFCRR